MKHAAARVTAEEPQDEPTVWRWPDDFVRMDSGRLLVRRDFVPVFEKLGWLTFDAVFENTECVVFRKISNRDNCVMELPSPNGRGAIRAFLKRHKDRAFRPWLKANIFSHGWKPAGFAEADAFRLCRNAGVTTLDVIAAGARPAGDNRWECDSFFMSEEIAAALPADDFWKRRFPGTSPDGVDRAPETHAARRRSRKDPPAPSSHVAGSAAPLRVGPPFLRLAPHPDIEAANRLELLTQFAEMARRLHASKLFHRDFYWCHFFVAEPQPDAFDVKLIDLQRIHRPKLMTWRWKLKDLAQFVFSIPEGMLTDEEKEHWFRCYRGIERMRWRDRFWYWLIELRASLYARRERRR